MKAIAFTTLFVLVCLQAFGQAGSKFSRAAVLGDLETLYGSLPEVHYDLYAYTTEAAFAATYQRVKAEISNDSLSRLEATNHFQRLISAVNNGHTEIHFPSQSYIEYAEAGGTLFPLELAFENGKSLVRKNFSENDQIKIGSEVLSINGLKMREVLTRIYPQLSAERPYFKKAKIEVYSFPRCYWQVFGEHTNFEVTIRSAGTVKTYSLKAVDLIEGYEMKRSEVLSAAMQLDFLEGAAYLNPGHFSGDEEQYQHFIDSAFTTIKKQGSQILILDLRNNGGGDNSFSDYLVSYIADQPFQWNGRFTLKTSQLLKEHVRKHNDTTAVYFQQILQHPNGSKYEYRFADYQPQAEHRRFHGKVYVLINRQSHSQAAVTAAQIQDYGFGTLVGEETGDYPSLYASQFPFSLPNTGIAVKVSKGYMVRVNGSTAARGVLPDMAIQDHLLDEDDEILEGLLRKIGWKP